MLLHLLTSLVLIFSESYSATNYKLNFVNRIGQKLLEIHSYGDIYIPKNLVVDTAAFFQGETYFYKSVYFSIIDIISNTTLNEEDCIVLCDASYNSIIVNLPDLNQISPGRIYIIKKIDNTSNTVNIIPYSGQSIDNQSSIILSTPYQTIIIVSYHNNKWYIISKYLP